MFREPRNSLPKVFIDPRVVVRESPIHGWGCFATEDIEQNVLIESAPVVIFHGAASDALFDINDTRHVLQDYPFTWKEGFLAFALGFAAIYNHLHDNNCMWKQNFEYETMEFTTKRKILAGEEITVRYLPAMFSGSLWFDDGLDYRVDVSMEQDQVLKGKATLDWNKI
ncbi:MAG TPA: SET domain-containing protein-lysine N-methyltransferase [Nitrospinaceae bacterium]|jgi:SET domain-containing protein|nr:SET domain-containing protein-lysine N-methyltransferase [Nitrospinaceae bacterium]